MPAAGAMAASTFIASATTSVPMPSPGIRAMLRVPGLRVSGLGGLDMAETLPSRPLVLCVGADREPAPSPPRRGLLTGLLVAGFVVCRSSPQTDELQEPQT